MSHRPTLRRIWKMRHAYVFIAPFYVLFLIFGAFPLVWSFILTLKEWDGLRPMKSVGLRNYILLLRDQRFLDAFGNTALYWAVNIVFILALSLLMAGLLNDQRLGGRQMYRLVLFLPNVTATVAVGLVFKMVFDYNSGLINGILGSLRLPILPWLNSTGLSKIPVMVLSIWRDTPWYMLIMISGLQTISPELHQAATVDGANPLQRLLHVTIPGLAPVLFFCFLTLTIDSFRTFTEPYIMTGGGPGSSSLSIVQYLYESGFTLFKLGYASSIAYVLTFILLIVSAAQVFVFRKRGSVVGGKAA